MQYVNSYILSVPQDKKHEYERLAQAFTKITAEYGALEIYENWELEVPDGEVTDFRKAVKAKPGEKIVLSWVVWPDRETGEQAHKNMFEDPRMLELGEMPFNGKYMIMGGFTPMIAFHKVKD